MAPNGRQTRDNCQRLCAERSRTRGSQSPERKRRHAPGKRRRRRLRAGWKSWGVFLLDWRLTTDCTRLLTTDY